MRGRPQDKPTETISFRLDLETREALSLIMQSLDGADARRRRSQAIRKAILEYGRTLKKH